MAFKFVFGALCALVVIQAVPADARTGGADRSNPIDPVRFDLHATNAAPTPEHASLGTRDASIGQVTREQADAAAVGRALPDPPAVSYEPVASGPIIELGAFGAKRKGVPGLVHFAVNWGF